MPDQLPPSTGTIRDVELVRVGTWNASTGVSTITRDHLAAAVAAYQDHLIDRPVIRLGHVDPRFDGEPAMGWVTNLRLADNGDTLLGDLVGMPAKLAEVAPTAYRRRSVELAFGVKSAAGKAYAAVLTGLALLGVAPPAVKGLADVLALYTGPADTAGRASLHIDSTARLLLTERTTSDTAPVPPVRVAAAEAGTDTSNPTDSEAAVSAELKKLLGLAEDASDADVLAAVQAGKGVQTPPAGGDQPPAGTEAPPAGNDTATTGSQPPAGDTSTGTTQPTAGSDTSTAPTAPAAPAPTAPAGQPAAFSVPAGTVLMSEAQAAEMQRVVTEHVTERRNRIIEAALREGRISPVESTKFREQLNENETATVALLSALTPQRVPTVELGSDGVGQLSAAQAQAEDAVWNDFNKRYFGIGA